MASTARLKLSRSSSSRVIRWAGIYRFRQLTGRMGTMSRDVLGAIQENMHTFSKGAQLGGEAHYRRLAHPYPLSQAAGCHERRLVIGLQNITGAQAGLEVLRLKRIREGTLFLDRSLKPGGWPTRGRRISLLDRSPSGAPSRPTGWQRSPGACSASSRSGRRRAPEAFRPPESDPGPGPPSWMEKPFRPPGCGAVGTAAACISFP